MSDGGPPLPNFEADWAPIVRPLRHRCESCSGTTRLLVYVPNGHGGGRRLCLDCLRIFDAIRARASEVIL